MTTAPEPTHAPASDASPSASEVSTPGAAPAATTATGSDARPSRLTDSLLLLLTFTAGVTDAISFFGLGGVFTANMTGNLVLVGMAGASGTSWTELLQGDVLRCATAFAGFALGMFGGFRLLSHGPTASPESPWPRRVTAALSCCFALHLIFLAGWWATGARPGTAAQAALILVSASAMGVQTSAARGLNRAGITTTFVTGTLTSLISGLAAGDRKHAALRCAVLTSLLAGGLAGGLLLGGPAVAAGAVAPVATALILVLAAWRLHTRRRRR